MIQTDNFFPLKRLLEWNIEHELELTTLSLKKGDVFLEKGQRSDYLYFVLHGFFRIYYYDLEGNEMTHVFCYDNSLATSPFSFFKGEENILYFKCHEDTELIQMTAVQLETLIAKENLGHVIRRLFLEFGMLMSRRVMSIHTETAEERYLKMMESYPKIFQKEMCIRDSCTHEKSIWYCSHHWNSRLFWKHCQYWLDLFHSMAKT